VNRLPAARVLHALGLPGQPPPTLDFSSVSTDTRTIQPGALFVALSGERFDGHAFLALAARAGARGAVVRRGTEPVTGLALFEVADTLEALGRLARDRRNEITGPVVAITGTNGKTSTKELVAAALAARYRVHATSANRNNLVGVPLTILGAPEGTEVLVVEAGASVPGEVARMRAIIEPTVGIITNVAPGHLAGFGSVAGVLRDKLALLEGVPLAFVGAEPKELAQGARRAARRVTTVGLRAGAEVRPERWSLDPSGRPVLVFRGQECRVPLIGAHQAVNAMFALALAAELKLELPLVARALAGVTLPPGRGEVLHSGPLTVINDAYNANPGSLAAALDTVQAMRGTRRLVIVVGSMLELGPESRGHHERLAAAIMAVGPDLIGAVGEFAPVLQAARPALGDRLVTAPSPEALGRALRKRLAGDELVLLKASRGVALERALPHLLNRS